MDDFFGDTTAPVGYDDNGEPIEEVTVSAPREFDWAKWVLIAASVISIYKLLSEKKA